MFTETMKPGNTTYELQRQGLEYLQQVFGSSSEG